MHGMVFRRVHRRHGWCLGGVLALVLVSAVMQTPPAVANDAAADTTQLLRLAQDPAADGLARMAAIEALGGHPAPGVVEALIAILEDDMRRRSGVWAAAIPALGALGDRRATPVLIAALVKRDERWLGREMAARALAALGDPAAIPALLDAAWMADTRADAIAALADLAAPQAREVFLGALDASEDEDTRRAAERGLRAIDEVGETAGTARPTR